ncbi:porin [Ferrimonas lipolytica]|uniref:Porin n=1 Tax=Ferrimonas lipolytica TaxID=2724191 RepID=A0A6H1UAZ7_9GAMM|nr:porin [Ferrimonas lipolytica]QIZ76008.1 porin [Ferrimonas lipolytica]
MELKKLSLFIALGLAMPTAMAATEANAEIDQLKSRVAQLESSVEVNSWIERFRVNGFASLAVGMAKDGAGYAGYNDDELNFSQDSLFAIQSTYQINSKMDATLQLISRGRDDWDLKTEWAFVSYEFDNGAQARAGKLRLPLFMLSDYLEVGYAYPFARPSAEVYSVSPVSSYTGVELLHTFDFDNSSLSVQPIWGEMSVLAEDSSFGEKSEFSDLYGLAATYEWERVTLRGSYFSSTSDKDNIDFLANKDVDFYGFGFRYDANEFMLMSEYTIIEVDDEYPDTDSFYAALSYPIGSVTPYIMYSVVESQDDDDRVMPMGLRSALDVERTTYSVGARWDFIAGAALKFDVSYSDDFNGSSAALEGNIGELAGLPGVPVVVDNFDEALVYTVKLDVMF